MAVAKPKYVWWDLDCCQVPRGRNPYEIRWMIESALNKKFGPGPVTIFAIGNINRIPRRVFELMSRAGIVMKHTPGGGEEIYHDLVMWTKKNPAPAILMLISDREDEYIYLEAEEAKGYTIVRTYANQNTDSPKYASDVWLWKNLFTDTEPETPRPRQEQCCETHWDCLLCYFKGQSFTDFTTHLKTTQHLRWEWIAVHPDASVGPSDKDLDSLYSQLMKHVAKTSKPRKSHPKQMIANPAMVKFLSQPPHKDADSFFAALRCLSRDYSAHSQPKKHTVSN